MTVQQIPTMSTESLVAANLRALLAFHDLTHTEVAVAMGKTRSWVQERCSGVRECKVSEAAEFARFFDVPIEELFWPSRKRGSSTRNGHKVHGGTGPDFRKAGRDTKPDPLIRAVLDELAEAS